MWDGTMDGAVAMGRPLAHEKRVSHGPGQGVTFRGERKGPGLRREGAFERD
jgi:hypothetical protein